MSNLIKNSEVLINLLSVLSQKTKEKILCFKKIQALFYFYTTYPFFKIRILFKLGF